jgi:hypothetical protein
VDAVMTARGDAGNLKTAFWLKMKTSGWYTSQFHCGPFPFPGPFSTSCGTFKRSCSSCEMLCSAILASPIFVPRRACYIHLHSF